MSEPIARPGLGGRLARLFGRAAPPPVTEPPPSLFATAAPVLTREDAPEPLFFNLVTAGGLLVGAGPSWMRSLAGADNTDALLLATIPGLRRQLGMLMAPSLAPFAVWPDVPEAAARAVLILPTDAPHIVRLRDPLSRNGFLTRWTPEEGEPDLRCDSEGAAMEATFSLVAVDFGAVPPGAAYAAGAFAAAAAEGVGLVALLKRLHQGRLGEALAPVALRLMKRADLAELGRWSLERPDDLALLQSLLPDDRWLRTTLPALREWSVSRPGVAPPGVIQSPATDDAFLPQNGVEANLPLGLVLNSLARRVVLPRRGACLLTTVRNEGPYLLDWLSHHLALGFEHAFVYSNENSDGSDALLEKLAQHGVITWIQNARGPRLGPQTKAYAHALMILPQILDYRWAAILDLDEYLAIDATIFASVQHYLALQETQPVDAIALNWLLFVGLPGAAWSDQSSIRRFTQRDRDVNIHVKSLIRPQLFWNAQPHFPYAAMDAPFDYRTQDGGVHHHRAQGRLAAFSETPAATQAWVNHYMLRTADEALWKWARGRADWTDESQSAWFLEFIAKTFLDLARPERLVEDTRIAACAAGQAGELDRLRALPGVAACDDAIKAAFAGQLRAARADFLARPGDASEPAVVTHFRDILDMANT